MLPQGGILLNLQSGRARSGSGGQANLNTWERKVFSWDRYFWSTWPPHSLRTQYACMQVSTQLGWAKLGRGVKCKCMPELGETSP